MALYFGDKIREARKAAGLTQRQLAEKIGVTNTSISNWEKNLSRPDPDTIANICDALLIAPNYLFGTLTKIPTGFDPMPDMSEVPLVGEIACGQPITAEENLEGYVSVPERWHADFTLICRGKSMEPKIHDGDLVAIRSGLQIDNGQIAAVRIDNEATLKRVYRYPERLILRPINEDFEEIVLEGEEINRASIEGKAVGLCRDI